MLVLIGMINCLIMHYCMLACLRRTEHCYSRHRSTLTTTVPVTSASQYLEEACLPAIVLLAKLTI